MPSPVIGLRVTDETKTVWQAAADEHGLKLLDWIRQTLDAEAQRAGGRPVAEIFPGPRSQTRDMVSITLPPKAKTQARSARTRCSNEAHHRPGVWCKSCGQVK